MKIFLRLAGVLLVMMISYAASAQTNYEDVVYLKNGSIIHGVIIEQIPNQSIKIRTRDRNVFVYTLDEISKITKEELPESQKGNQTGNTGFKDHGFVNYTELSFGLGTGDRNSDSSYGFQTVNGNQFNPIFSLGFGIGVDKYRYATFVPVFADFRFNFIRSSVTPYFATGIGYSLGFDGNKGGLLLNPSFGLKFYVSSQTACTFSAGYRLQQNSYDIQYYFYGGSYTQSLHFINIKFGVSF